MASAGIIPLVHWQTVQDHFNSSDILSFILDIISASR